MEETYTREEKLESLEGICRYNRKLVEVVDALADDLEEGETDIHSEVFGKVMQGINWTVAVLQQMMDILEEKEKKLEKEAFNEALMAFDKAYREEDEVELVLVMKGKLIPALEQLCDVGEQFFDMGE